MHRHHQHPKHQHLLNAQSCVLKGERKGRGLLSCTWMVSFSRLQSRLPGMKPAPMPWILCGPGAPPEMTGDSVGSTAMICTSDRNCLFVRRYTNVRLIHQGFQMFRMLQIQ